MRQHIQVSVAKFKTVFLLAVALGLSAYKPSKGTWWQILGFPPHRVFPTRWTARGKTVLHLAADTCGCCLTFLELNLVWHWRNYRITKLSCQNLTCPPKLWGTLRGRFYMNASGKILLWIFSKFCVQCKSNLRSQIYSPEGSMGVFAQKNDLFLGIFHYIFPRPPRMNASGKK